MENERPVKGSVSQDAKMNFSFWFQDREFKVNLKEKRENDFHIMLDGKEYHVLVEFITKEELLLTIDGKVYDITVTPNSNSYFVRVNGKNIQVEKKSASQLLGKKSHKAEKREVKTFMPGRIVKLLIKEGENVEEGQPVLILEAMKMQNEIKSPKPGHVSKIGPAVGDSVEVGSLLFTVE